MKIEIDTRTLEKKLGRIAGGADRMALDIVNRLTGWGEEVSKMLASVDMGELRSSIRSVPATMDGSQASGYWHATSGHAAFVEYGTGAPGARGEVANGQPRAPEAAGFTYTLETIIQSGPRAGQTQPGWVYFDELRQTFVHTLGQPARPFMYPAARQVLQAAGEQAAVSVRNLLKEK